MTERTQILATLAGARADLLQQYLSLSEEILSTRPVFDTFTPKDILAHIGAWDELHTGRINAVLSNHPIPNANLDENNAEWIALHKSWSLDQALVYFLETRQGYLDILQTVSDEVFFQERPAPWGRPTSIKQWTQWRSRHDIAHTNDLKKWRENEKPLPSAGPLTLLVAALQASQHEIETRYTGLTEDQIATEPVMDTWTRKDLIGHITAWEQFGLPALQNNEIPNMGYDGDVEQWNQAQYEIRKDHSWSQIWQDYQQTRQTWLQHLVTLTSEQLDAPTIENAWGNNPTPYRWTRSFLTHEQEHAHFLRSIE